MLKINQFNKSGQLIDSLNWHVGQYDLHVVTFDVLIKQCVRVEYGECSNAN